LYKNGTAMWGQQILEEKKALLQLLSKKGGPEFSKRKSILQIRVHGRLRRKCQRSERDQNGDRDAWERPGVSKKERRS